MIRVLTDELAEARVMARLLRDSGPGTPYRVLLKDEEFTLDGEPPGLDRCRTEARLLLRDAGAGGMSLNDLHVRLYQRGFRVSKSTVYRWLDRWAEDGDARNPRRGLWIWVTGRTA
jgi:hypothetical protein